jgi:hypothetical protein
MRKPLLGLAGAAALVALQAGPAVAQDTLNCEDVATQQEALDLIQNGDPHNLDDDDDGWPCEAKFGESLQPGTERPGGNGTTDQLPRTGPEEELALAGGLLVAGGASLVVLSRRSRRA